MVKSDNNPESIAAKLEWLRDELKEDIKDLKKGKADRTHIESELENIRKTNNRIRMLVEDLSKKEHKCVQLEVIGDMKKSIEKVKSTLDGFKTIKLGVFLIVLTAVGGAVASHVSLQSTVESSVSKNDLEATKIELTNKIDQINRVDKNQKVKDAVQHKNAMKKVFKEVLEENASSSDSKIKRKKKSGSS